MKENTKKLWQRATTGGVVGAVKDVLALGRERKAAAKSERASRKLDKKLVEFPNTYRKKGEDLKFRERMDDRTYEQSEKGLNVSQKTLPMDKYEKESLRALLRGRKMSKVRGVIQEKKAEVDKARAEIKSEW